MEHLEKVVHMVQVEVVELLDKMVLYLVVVVLLEQVVQLVQVEVVV